MPSAAPYFLPSPPLHPVFHLFALLLMYPPSYPPPSPSRQTLRLSFWSPPNRPVDLRFRRLGSLIAKHAGSALLTPPTASPRLLLLPPQVASERFAEQKQKLRERKVRANSKHGALLLFHVSSPPSPICLSLPFVPSCKGLPIPRGLLGAGSPVLPSHILLRPSSPPFFPPIDASFPPTVSRGLPLPLAASPHPATLVLAPLVLHLHCVLSLPPCCPPPSYTSLLPHLSSPPPRRL